MWRDIVAFLLSALVSFALAQSAGAESRQPNLSPLDKEIICHAQALTCESKCDTRISAEGRWACKIGCRNVEARCVKRASTLQAPGSSGGDVKGTPNTGPGLLVSP